MASKNVKNEISKGHVYYFEPNDLEVGRDNNGNEVPLMGHFEDMCVSMSLTADIFPRYRGGNLNRVQRSLAWVSYVDSATNEPIDISKHIINRGTKLGTEEFLTTYYTEISADSYIENELVEGLGVTSIDISYESWYTPTITIKFIDVRGSALFGREEAIHKNGQITANNVLGVFFTVPYPLFRLQVKGFLGKDVTYQLSVSSFNGSYNSQTGNFEIIVSFIGYNYSLLTDVPIKLLSVIPDVSYAAKAYWDRRVNDDAWQLIDTDGTKRPPIKLYELIDRIRSAVGIIDSTGTNDCEGNPSGEEGATPNAIDPTTSDRVVSQSEANIVTNSKNNLDSITALRDSYKKLTLAFEALTEAQMVGGSSAIGLSKSGNQRLMFFRESQGDSSGFKFSNRVQRCFKDFKSKLESYVKKNNFKVDSAFVSLPQLSKCIIDGTPYPWRFFQKHNLGINPGNIKELSNSKVFQKTLNSGLKGELDKFIRTGKFDKLKVLNDKNGSFFNKSITEFKDVSPYKRDTRESKLPLGVNNTFSFETLYSLVLDLGDINQKIEEEYNRIVEASNNIETKIDNEVTNQASESSNSYKNENEGLSEEEINEKIVEIVGFEPTIGNFVKLLMCHLETFVHVMMTCEDEIHKSVNDKIRLVKNFNISDLSKETDINNRGTGINDSDVAILPWPGLNAKQIKSEDNSKSALGWVGDYKPKAGVNFEWAEEKVVRSCLDAVMKYEEKVVLKSFNGENFYNTIPLSASDLSHGGSAFSEIASSCNSVDALAIYLGLRASNVIGLGHSNCGTELAEALGSVDALNLLSSSTNYSGIRNSLNPQDNEQNFVGYVTKYLLCDSSVAPTNETEDGSVSYYTFEFLKGNDEKKNMYNSKNHSMFVKTNNGKYLYSYIYTKVLDDKIPISLLPSSIKSFNGSVNPYSSEFNIDTSGDYSIFNPNNGYGSVLYGVKSDKLVKVSTDNYTNDFIFNVITDHRSVSSLIDSIIDYKSGKIKLRGYSLPENDKNFKLVIDTKYKVSYSDYANVYRNVTDRIIFPKLNDVITDYSNSHLVYKKEDANSKTFDSEIFSPSNGGDIATKTNKSNSKGEENIIFNDVEYGIANINLLDLRLTVNGEVTCSLFGSKLFYKQNDIVNETERKLAKLYLILSSMMSGIGKINLSSLSGDNGIVELVQPFIVLFLGALIWRKEKKDDPLKLDSYNVSKDLGKTLISKNNKLSVSTSASIDYRGIEDYLVKYDSLDIAVKNKLVSLFYEYANGSEFNEILKCFELKTVKGKTIGATEYDELCKKWVTYTSNDSSKPSSWSSLFGNAFPSYSVIQTISQGQPLNLLFNETSNGVTLLNNLYGLRGGYLISGIGAKNNSIHEIELSSEQLNAYLKGFNERALAIIKATEDKEDEASANWSDSDGERTDQIALYYTLKQIWDSWLVTSSVDQFTIENFFNKSFIFMDSFYVNMYNKIKLNCEQILRSYNVAEKSLFSFMTDVTSHANCLFASVPSFIDTNMVEDNGVTKSTLGAYKKIQNGDVAAWRKSDLANMFTPYEYNKIGVPRVNNVFMFVYTHQFSKIPNNDSQYNVDSYNMDDTDTWPNELNKSVIEGYQDKKVDDKDVLEISTNNHISEDEELVVSRYGYLMPCFGVAMNRQNNHIFKSINVGMDSARVTSVSAETYSNILQKYGGDNKKKIYFRGQDTFSIYSQYSYSCDIEMLGCAQIQPLMYFQLLNLPMWRGTYMIYKVNHNITPGNMVTRFSGIKMSRTQTPFAGGYISRNKNANTVGSDNRGSNGRSGSSSGGFPVGGIEMIKNIFAGTDISNYKIGEGGGAFNDKTFVSFRGHQHKGVDIQGPTPGVIQGVSLHAPWDGTIVQIGRAVKGGDGGGNRVYIESHDKLFRVVYMHCHEIFVKQGQEVKFGDKIASVGSTGHATGPHLHLGLFINGRFGSGNEVDPTTFYGYTGSRTTSQSNKKQVEDKGVINNVNNNIAVVGDSWGQGIAPLFKRGFYSKGEAVDKIISRRLPGALASDCDTIVICCGFNSIKVVAETKLRGQFEDIGQQCKKYNKKCYVTTFPKLGNSNVTDTDIEKLNKIIREGSEKGNYTVITNETIDKKYISGYHLQGNGYTVFGKKILEGISK